MSWTLDCPFCRVLDAAGQACPECGGPLDARSTGSLTRRDGRGVWKYRELLPAFDGEPVTLFEGDTPLIDCGGRFLLKFEGSNPTGSFKDRGMTVAVSMALAAGARRLACASTGNTSASLAAYAARAGIEAAAYLPEGKVAAGKLAQAVACGMRIVPVAGGFDQAFARMGSDGALWMNSTNPARIEGQKTLAFEICDALGGRAPDAVALPVGNGGNIRAIWKGFREYERLRWIARLPRMIAVQAEGAAWLARGPVEAPETVASAIRIGRGAHERYVRAAVAESGGEVVAVSDAEILAAQGELARRHGVFVEPASAAPVAALSRLRLEGLVVSVATGHGLKDPDTPIAAYSDRRGW
jgi:threonine synthase